MNNPFIGMTAGAWMVFLLTCGVADFRWWAWMLWVPWLTFATIAPVVWWWKHRKPNPANLARESASVDQHSVVGLSK